MYLVVFRNRKHDDMDHAAYQAQAERMERLARAQPGFISFKSYTADDGEAVAISEWADAASAKAWGRVAEHRTAQADGRRLWYAQYTLFGCDSPQVREFP